MSLEDNTPKIEWVSGPKDVPGDHAPRTGIFEYSFIMLPPNINTKSANHHINGFAKEGFRVLSVSMTENNILIVLERPIYE